MGTQEEAAIIICQTTCPGEDWRLHNEGIAPEVAYQYELQSETHRLAKKHLIIAIVVGSAV